MSSSAYSQLRVMNDSQRAAMAEFLGVDLAQEPELRWIVEQALVSPLPAGWAEYTDDASGAQYYYHAASGQSTYEHPNDEKFIQMVEEERARGGGHVVSRWVVIKKAALKQA